MSETKYHHPLNEYCTFCRVDMPQLEPGFWQCPKCKSYWDRRKKSRKKSVEKSGA